MNFHIFIHVYPCDSVAKANEAELYATSNRKSIQHPFD